MPTDRLSIDWTACAGRGHCIELLPELLTEDPWGYPLPRNGGAGRGVAVPAGLAGPARRAAASCPRLALHLQRS
ncbi:MAG: ferredoxin [Kineosporiaceae bacterium]|jgi:ferredoxin